MNDLNFSKRLIEWNLPLLEISTNSSREKSLRNGNPSTLHIWWARRPLSASRTTIFSSLINLREQKEENFELIELVKRLAPFETIFKENQKTLEEAREIIKNQWDNNPPKVLDPFSGGGSIPLEALRLGCDTYANDLNPVAVLIEKTTIEWPAKFGIMIDNPESGKKQVTLDGTSQKINLLSYTVNYFANRVMKRVKDEVGKYYNDKDKSKTIIGFIWVKTIPCQNPSCGKRFPLIKQFWLSKKENRKITYRYNIQKDEKNPKYLILYDEQIQANPSIGTISRGKAKCPYCNQVTLSKQIEILASKNELLEIPIIKVYTSLNKKGRSYEVLSSEEISKIESIKKCLINKEGIIPDQEIDFEKTSVYNIYKFGYKKWRDLYNPRQLLTLTTIIEQIKSIRQEIVEYGLQVNPNNSDFKTEEFTNAILGYLSILLGKLSDYSGKFCRWHVSGEKMSSTFARQVLPMVWDSFESNPFSGLTGSYQSQLNLLLKVIETNSFNNSANFKITNVSATSLPYQDDYFDAVITDPPYYDNIFYSDLSDYFYVWHKKCIGDYFPELFATPLTPKTSEIVANKKRNEDAKQFFETKLSSAFSEMYRVLKTNGIAIIVYAHKTTAGWETLLESIINAGFVVTASWPIRTEMPGRSIAMSSAALASSIYLVCRKKVKAKSAYFSEIKNDADLKIKENLKEFWNVGISGGDFFISAIGPAMEIFSKYESIETYSGEKISILEILDFIRKSVIEYIIERLLKTSESTSIDNEGLFYLMYRWTYLSNQVEFDDARKLASACGFSLEENWGKSGFIKKTGSKISVLGPQEREKIHKTKNFVNALHKAAILWEKGNFSDLNEFLQSSEYGKSSSFWLFCQAISECLLFSSKEKKLLEGLILSKKDRKDIKIRKTKGIDEYFKSKK